MAEMVEVHGNLFDGITNESYIAHCISSDYALGAGIAKEIEARFHVRSKLRGNARVCPTAMVTGRIINLVTKIRHFDKPTYKTLERALVSMRAYCEANEITEVHMPRIGSGLDRLSWGRVREVIINVFNGSDIKLIVYYL